MRKSDFRSDTVTRPTEAMRRCMAEAAVGDDVYGEDPTVNRLESQAAKLLGHQGALWLPTGTQANLAALLSHCQRGDAYIVGQQGHCYRFEGGGAAVLGSIQPQPIPFAPDGSLDLDEVARAVKPRDNHFARTRLVCLENTQSGRVVPLSYLRKARRLCDDLGLALHLDGARLFNAALASGEDVQSFAGCCDSVTLCLSKGLGAPAGTILAGSTGLIDAARRWRKVLGGGMRQVGILAAAGCYALEHHVERLAEDHALARQLAERLACFPHLNIDQSRVETNMVFAYPSEEMAGSYREWLKQHDILVGGYDALRFVTHLDVTEADVDKLVRTTKAFFTQLHDH